jgi:hypothetical protein
MSLAHATNKKHVKYLFFFVRVHHLRVFSFCVCVAFAQEQGDQIWANYRLSGGRFTLGSFFENYGSGQNVLATLFPQYKLCINFDKTWIGWDTFRVTFFTKLSGHPAPAPG